ncbi:MAG: hypothetical protein ACOCWB_07340 [Bacteroidota bacterium]
MKKVLILAYDFPPYNSIGGQRPYSWFKYFKQFGLFPVVVTRHWDESITTPKDYIKPSIRQDVSLEEYEEGVVYRVPFVPNVRDRFILKHGTDNGTIIRKILSVWYMCVEFFVPFFDAKYSIYKKALSVCTNDDFSYIIASGEPFILFKYASKISQKTAVPWIADYRDGWSLNYNYSRFQRMFFLGIEKRLIRSCSCITTVSEEFQHQCAEFHSKPVYVIMNGFESIAGNLSHKAQSSGQFCMSFAGTMYPYQQIEMCSDALRMCKKEVLDAIKIQWIGLNFYPEQKKKICEVFSGIPVHHAFTDRIPQRDVISLLQKSSVLLLPASDTKNQVYAKIFDYLQVKRTIFLFPSDNGTLQEIIDNTSSGYSFANAKDLYTGLMDVFNEWKQNGFVECKTHSIEQYSRKNQAEKFVQILLNKN